MQRWMRLILWALLSRLVVSTTPDQDENCHDWANSGECDKNPGYMLSSCAASCEKVAMQALKDAKEFDSIGSFFDLQAKDIHGKMIDFKEFEGQVTVVVNVASECGYTDSHYTGLGRLWKQVEPTKRVKILAFPCNQFGQQEPGSGEEIYEFAVGEYGVKFTLMEKVDVNGPNASIVYKYLKSKAGPASITWNFATYYVVSPDGSITSHSGVEPMDLKDRVLSLVQSDEL
jgi:glutathione peroxidase